MARLAGDRFRNRIVGNATDDLIIGLRGVDRLAGGAGDDRLEGGSGGDLLEGGNGNDTIYAYELDLGDDLDVDTLNGGAGSDRLHAGVGDLVDGGANTDFLHLNLSRAAAGLFVDFSGLLSGGTLALAGGTLVGIERVAQVRLTEFNDTLTIGTSSGQSVVAIGGGGADTITGSAGADTIYAGDPFFDDDSDVGGFNFGETAVDTLNGGAGNDTIYAGIGDAVDGGAGTDTLSLDLTAATAGLTIDFAPLLAGGSLTVAGGALVRVERLSQVYLSNFADTVTIGTTTNGVTVQAGGGADNITGGGGADVIYSSGFEGDDGAADTLNGAGGDDTIFVGLNDNANGGSGVDTILLDLTGATTGLALNLSALYTGGSVTIGTGTLAGFEGVTSVQLGQFNDTLTLGSLATSFTFAAGGAGSDSITGGAGSDYLYGDDDGAVADTLRGGSGFDSVSAGLNDVADGGADIDTLSLNLSAAATGVALDLTAGFTGGFQAVAGGSFTGFEQVDFVRLTDFADTLTVGTAAYDSVDISGGRGADTINGGAGNDFIEGGSEPDDLTEGADPSSDDGAADTLSGGAGDDEFDAAIADNVDGGTGVDTLRLDLRNAAAGLNADFTAAFTGGAVTVLGGTLTGLEDISGLYLTNFDDAVTIGAAGEDVRAGGGNDRVTGSALVDDIDGGTGDDALLGLAGDDDLFGGAGRDRLEGGDGDDLLFGDFDLFDEDGGARESVVGEADDVIIGGAGNDEMHGGFGRDTAVYADLVKRHSYAVGGAHGTVTFGIDVDDLDSMETLLFRDGAYTSLDEDSVHAEVARLYDTTLQRMPDLGGLDYHAGRITNGTATLLDVATDFLYAPEYQQKTGSLDNGAFVDFLYRNALGREPDAPGRAYWAGQLDGGLSRAQMLVLFSESGEHRAGTAADIVDGWFEVDPSYKLVALIYDTALGRRPDGDGLTYWAEAFKAGAQTPGSLAAAFAGSGEFAANTNGLNNAQLVNYMYVNTLDRPADQGGLDYWTGQLNAGLTRGDLLFAFANSDEHAFLYRAFTDDGIVVA